MKDENRVESSDNVAAETCGQTPEQEKDRVKQDRLDNVFKAATPVNPFQDQYAEYVARFTFAKQWYAAKDDPQAAAQLEQAKQRLGVLSGIMMPQAGIITNMQNRHAALMQWYDGVVYRAKQAGVDPELVEYIWNTGMPVSLARRFYEAGFPPASATAIYTMIYQKPVEATTLFQAQGKPSPVPVAMPTKPGGSAAVRAMLNAPSALGQLPTELPEQRPESRLPSNAKGNNKKAPWKVLQINVRRKK